MKWKVIFEKEADGQYTVTVPSLPGCISQGQTKEEASKNIKEAIELHVESLAKDGIPLTGKQKLDTVAVNL